jgi:hypothetical protein
MPTCPSESGYESFALPCSRRMERRWCRSSARVPGQAETIRDEQRAEIFQMQEWLRAWFGGGWQHGMYGGGPGGMPGGPGWMS